MVVDCTNFGVVLLHSGVRLGFMINRPEPEDEENRGQ